MSNPNFPQIDLQTSQQYVQVNRMFQAVVPSHVSAIKLSASSALSAKFHGGDGWSGSAFITRSDETEITLTASATNYIEENPETLVITKNVSAFTTGLRPLSTIATGASGITLGGIADYRRIAWQDAKVRFNSVDFVVGGTAPTTGWYSSSSDLIRTPNSVVVDDSLTVSGQYIAGTEILGSPSVPDPPASNGYRIFAQDNGAGKTRLMVIFATGAAQELAIEP